MENKYYTPIIEEFCVGFEYEQKERFSDGTVKSKEDYENAKWISEVFKDGDYPYIERALTGRNAINGLCGIRVKFLDREDIESLGYEIKREWLFNKYYYKIIKYREGDCMCAVIHNSVSNWILIEITINKENKVVFAGKIKNKSELIKLMKQLGI